MSSSNQRPANRGFRSVLRCAITHYRQFSWLSAPEPIVYSRNTGLPVPGQQLAGLSTEKVKHYGRLAGYGPDNNLRKRLRTRSLHHKSQRR